MNNKGSKKKLYVFSFTILTVLLAGLSFAATTGPIDLFVAITTGNTAPVVYNVTPFQFTPAAGTQTQVDVVFNVTDADGSANLNDALARVNVTLIGYGTKTNDTGNCQVVTTSFSGGLDRTYSCAVVFDYFDNSSVHWIINASAGDSASTAHTNSTVNGTINSLSAFSVFANSIGTSASLGSTNNELSFVINNTGNFDFVAVNVTPFALNASLTDYFMLDGNFSINGSQSGSGQGTNLVNATGVNITQVTQSDPGVSITLNKSNSDGSGGSHVAYIYIDLPNDKGLSSAVTYNSSQPWQLWAR